MNSYLSSWDQFTQLEEALAKNCINLPAISIAGQGLLNNGFLIEIDCIGTTKKNVKRINIPNLSSFGNMPAITQIDDYVFLSGFAGIDINGKVIKKGDIRAQTQQALEWVRIGLEQVGATPRDVIKNHTTIVDWRDFDKYNEIYAEFYGQPYPTRALSLIHI